MITIGTLRELRDTPLCESGDDYLPGVELEDLEMFSESAFVVDIKDMDDEILTEGAGSEIWNKIKKAFQAIINFFKMLGSKIKGFISGFFKKAEDAVDKAEKEDENVAFSEEDMDTPEYREAELKAMEELERMLKEVEEKEQEIKETPAEDKEKVADLKSDVAETKEKIKRKYTRSKTKYRKPSKKIDVKLYTFGGSPNKTKIIEMASNVFRASTGLSSVSLQNVFSRYFRDAIEDLQKETNTKNRETYVKEVDSFKQTLPDDIKRILEVKIDYTEPGVLDACLLVKTDDIPMSKYLSLDDLSLNKNEAIDTIKKTIDMGKAKLLEFTKDIQSAEKEVNKLISDLNSYQKDPTKNEYAHIFKLQAQCCNKMVGVINKILAMYTASIRKAIQYDIQQLNHFKNTIKN